MKELAGNLIASAVVGGIIVLAAVPFLQVPLWVTGLVAAAVLQLIATVRPYLALALFGVATATGALLYFGAPALVGSLAQGLLQ